MVLFEWLLAALGLVLAARLALGAPLLEAWVERRPPRRGARSLCRSCGAS
jgi:hypothetical protein